MSMTDHFWTFAPLAKTMLEAMDRQRRRQGEALEAAGYGPVETPYRVVHAERGVTLRRYGDPASPSDDRPALVIVPAPIKRPTIWDLAPEVSVVRRCLEHGMTVYLADWARPEAEDATLGLADYADRLLAGCLRAVEADCGARSAVLAGHSLGGLFAAVFSCLHPERVRALVLVEAPLHFGADAGSFAPWVAAAPDAYRIADAFGNIPGSFLDLVSVAAAPHAFQWERQLDRRLAAADAQALRSHLQVERWSCDESAMPGRLFADIVEQLYRHDAFLQGRLALGGRRIGPADLKCPLLNVVDPRSTVVPPQSILPAHDAAASTAKRIVSYRGDVGVGLQHVGALAGRDGQAAVWSEILDWLDHLDRSRPGADLAFGTGGNPS